MEAAYSQRKGFRALAITLFIIALVAMNMGTMLYAQQGTSRDIPQYLFNKFNDGMVKKKSGEIVVTPLNYNVVTEEMIFFSNDQYLALGALQTIDTVYLNKMVFVPFGI